MARVSAVLFDVDGTLYRQAPLRACMAAEIAASALTSGSVGRTRKLVRMLKAYRMAHEAIRGVTVPSGTLVADLQIRTAAEQACVDEDELRPAVSEWMFRRPMKYLFACRRPGLFALLARLDSRGVRLGVLSDYPSKDKLEALRVGRYFRLALCTTDSNINALKPDPRGFWRACELWNLPPDEVLYVGDRPEVDSCGASAAGIRCAIIGPRYHEAGRSGVPKLRDVESLLA